MTSQPQLGASGIHLPRATVLVVDDSVAMREMVREQLWTFGVRVRLAQDGEECLRMAQAQPPDLILLDVLMPGIDGFEACQALKADPRTEQVPVMFMTALNQTADKLRGFEVGGVDFVTKPIDVHELVARIATHLALRSARQDLQTETETHRQTATELQRRSDQLNDAMAKLLRGEQLVLSEKMAAAGALSAGIAHEVANPAQSALLAAEDLEADLARFRNFLDELAGEDAPAEVTAAFSARFDRLNQALGVIRDSTSRIRNLAQDLSLFSRQEGRTEQIRLGALLASTANLVRPQFRHQVTIEIDCQTDPLVEVNVGRFGQVFMNLLVNACQASRDHGRSTGDRNEGRVKGGVRIDKDELCIDVIDDGYGIDAETRERLFEPFFTTKPAGEGTGLGLSMSQRIVSDHGGCIEVDSTPGKGSRFTVRLPLPTNDGSP